MTLTLELAPTKRRLTLYGAPRSRETKRLLSKHGLKFEHSEFMVDFVIKERKTPTKEDPLIACESEIGTSHGVKYRIDRDNGYVWDFHKLLQFKAPHLLFVARVRVGELGALERTLEKCAKEYKRLWEGDRLSIVLLPGAHRRRDLIRIGKGLPNGSVAFESLEL